MRTQRVLNNVSASGSPMSDIVYSHGHHKSRINRDFLVFLRLTDDPTGEAINVDLQVRADGDADWYVVDTFTGVSHTYQNPTGSIHQVLTVNTDMIMPQISLQVNASALSTNRITAWIMGH